MVLTHQHRTINQAFYNILLTNHTECYVLSSPFCREPLQPRYIPRFEIVMLTRGGRKLAISRRSVGREVATLTENQSLRINKRRARNESRRSHLPLIFSPLSVLCIILCVSTFGIFSLHYPLIFLQPYLSCDSITHIKFLFPNRPTAKHGIICTR